MEIKPQPFAAAIFMLGYTLFGLMGLQMVTNRKNCNSSIYHIHYFRNYTKRSIDYLQNEDGIQVEMPQAFENRYCAGGFHGFYSCLAVFILGYAIAVYRLLNGFRTYYVKFLHVGLHIIALIVFAYGYYHLYKRKYDMFYDKFHFHKQVSIIVTCVYFLQFLVGLIFFTLQRNIRVRLMFAPFHDVFGIWLLVALVGCIYSGKRFAIADYEPNEQLAHYVITFMTYSFVLVVVLNPYFEWDLVGIM